MDRSNNNNKKKYEYDCTCISSPYAHLMRASSEGGITTADNAHFSMHSIFQSSPRSN